MEKSFRLFAAKFDMDDNNIKRKYEHSLRVEKLCEDIARSIKLSNHYIEVSKVIGLLHDYGRFYQWTNYKTFKDSKSIDHADYGAYELFQKDEINKFYKNKEDFKAIYEAIIFHNKYKVPKNAVSSKLCKIIRDADKLDILYMFKTGEFKMEEDGGISDKVKNEFYNHKLINHFNKKTNADLSLGYLSFIFDLNYKYSFEYLKNNKILDKIYKNIINKEKFKPYFEEINEYIDLKLKEEKLC